MIFASPYNIQSADYINSFGPLILVRIFRVYECGEPLQIMRVRLGACKTGLSPPVIYITDRSKAMLLFWF